MTEKEILKALTEDTVLKIVKKLETDLNMSYGRALRALEIVAMILIPYMREYVLKEIQKK